jgi:hypothetical protein
VSQVQPKLMSTRTPLKPNRVTGLSVAAGSRLLVRLLPQLLTCKRLPVVGSRPSRCYQGVLLMSQPKRWPLTILLAQLACQGGACFSTEATDHGGAVEPEVIQGHLSHPEISILECEPFFE